MSDELKKWEPKPEVFAFVRKWCGDDTKDLEIAALVKKLDAKDAEIASLTRLHEMAKVDCASWYDRYEKQGAELATYKNADFVNAILTTHKETIERLEGQLAKAQRRLAYRGKATKGVFCDGCADWEQMAWEATNDLEEYRGE